MCHIANVAKWQSGNLTNWQIGLLADKQVAAELIGQQAGLAMQPASLRPKK